jgi:methyl-accepting chemotaxis protein
MDKSSLLLDRFSGELKKTGNTLADSLQGFVEASSRMGQIASISEEQQTGLKEMSDAVWKIQNASEQFVISSKSLLEQIDLINASSTDLGMVLNSDINPV